jgi:hypothetical protein
VAEVIAAGFDGHAHEDPGHNPEGLGHADDMALLLLVEPVDGVEMVGLLTDPAELSSGRDLSISGYGVTAPGRHDGGQLHVGTIRYVRRNHFELYAEADAADACPGDSGGPAYLLDPGTGAARLVAVSSRGAADAPSVCGEGGIWTLAAPYETWIRREARGAYPAAPVEPSEVVAGCALAPGGDGRAWLLVLVAALAQYSWRVGRMRMSCTCRCGGCDRT